MTKKVAYSTLQIKSTDDDQRIIRGIASTPTPDRDRDVMVPEGAKFSLPMPLLYQHRHDMPIGQVTEAKVTKNGIQFTAKLAAAGIDETIDKAWRLIKAGLIRGVSIGFRAVEAARKDDGGYTFLKWDWYELSAVTVPANTEASIQVVKNFDAPFRDRQNVPGAAGSQTPHKETRIMTLAEQIAAFEAQKAAKAQRLAALINKSAEEARTLSDEESAEYDTTKNDLAAIEKHLARLRDMERLNLAAATPVPTEPTSAAATQARGAIVTVKSNLPKGTGFTRFAMALAAAHGNRYEALQYAKRWHDSTPEVEMVLKAAVDAGTTTDATWASTLVDYQTLAAEFIELLRPQTIVGRLNLRRVPFNVRMPSQTAGGTYSWVGEGSAKPVGELATSEVTLRWAKAAGIIVVSEELLRVSNPSAEAIVRDDMIAGIANFLDVQFVDPEVAEVSNVSPASVTNGVTPIIASGTDGDAVRTDIKALWTTFLQANIVPSSGVWIMSNTTAMALSMMRNALGQKEFPDINATGGTLEGYPVITSEAVVADTNGSYIVFLNQRDVFLADDGAVTIDVSREASVQMNTTPDNPTSASTVMVSLWQRNLVGIRAERYINWKKRRSAAVGYITHVNYGA